MCILVLLMLMGIVHVLTHQNEMDFIRNSYALRGIMSSSMSKVGGLFDLETKEMHRLTSNFTIDKDVEKMMPTDHEFRDTKYKGENSAERKGQPRIFKEQQRKQKFRSMRLLHLKLAAAYIAIIYEKISARNLENAKNLVFTLLKIMTLKSSTLTVRLGQQ